jgi:uncharacterized protein (DUF885 family)
MRLVLAAMLAVAALPAKAAPADDLRTVMADHWTWYLKNNPIAATRLGQRRYDDRIDDVSLAAADRRAADAKAFVGRLDRIPDAGLAAPDRVNKAILRRSLGDQIAANGFGQRMILFSNSSGYHQQIAGLGDYVPLRTKADYVSLVTRYEQYPAANAEIIRISRQAVAGGYTLPCEAMVGFDKTISGLIVDDPTKARAYEPFTRAKPVDATDAEWSAMQARGRKAITEALNPANRAFLTFYTTEYAPKCAKAVGISAQPNGAAYYAFKIRQQTTTDLTADQIHTIGLGEVKRIVGEMDALAKSAGYPSRAAFVAKLRSDPKYFAKTPEELMQANARVAKTIDGKMPGLFGRLPRLPYGLREIPAETAEGTTTAYYTDGSPESGLSGTYWINTSRLNQRPLWEIPALTAHESVPGHHNQIALQQELDLPPYRKNAVFFTAFVEGWGLYSERLGIEMGLYDTPEKNMGRLSYEMWRACRLVVDTGLHAKGWTKAQAIAFMKDNTALTDANIEAEVNRYIADPGQALAYKLGELKIRELRGRAEKTLGPKFDLRRFHDVVLGQGPVPLDVLDAQVSAWIAGGGA